MIHYIILFEWVAMTVKLRPAMVEREAVDLSLAHACFDTDPRVLAEIRRPGVNLAVWQRGHVPPLPGGELLDRIDDIGVEMAVARTATDLPGVLRQAGYPRSCVAGLANDVAMLARHMGGITGCESVAIRLEIVETDACKRFHTDYVSVRLISSYAGPATQWLSDADAAALRDGADPAALTIRTLATGDIALFKGRRWAEHGAIFHRSPPIAGTGVRRLVLVLDPGSDAPRLHG